MGWLIRHIHNTNLASESLVKCMSVKTLIRAAPIAVQQRIVAARGDHACSHRSVLGSTTAVMYGGGGRTGAGRVWVKPHRKNSRKASIAELAPLLQEVRRVRGRVGVEAASKGKRMLELTSVTIDGHRWKTGSGYAHCYCCCVHFPLFTCALTIHSCLQL
jgi:hypothetical protein